MCINTVFRVAPQIKSNGVKSNDLGEQLISPRREIMRPGIVSCNKAIFARIVWQVRPSCWNYIFSNSYSSIAGKKVGYHMIIMLRTDGDSRSIIVFEEVWSNYTFKRKSLLNSDIT